MASSFAFVERPSSFEELLASRGEKLSFAVGGNAAGSDSAPSTVLPDGGDYKAGLIQNVVLAKVGQARGWGHSVEQEFINSIVELANAKPDGLKCRFEHPSERKPSLGSVTAAIKNVRVVADMAVGDMHLLASASKSPIGDLRDYILTLAAERPDFFGLSIYGEIGQYYFYNAAGERTVIASEKEYLEFLSMPDNTPWYITLAVLDATDAVDEGALTKGLFAAARGKESNPTKPQKSPNPNPVAMSKKNRLAFDINATASDGSSIRIATDEPTPDAGNEVFVVADDGTETAPDDGDITISDGPYDGYVLSVQNGVIVTVTEPDGDVEADKKKEDKPSGDTTQMSAGEKAIMGQLKKLNERIDVLENTPLGQHVNSGGSDTFQGKKGPGRKLAQFEVIAKQREEEAKEAHFPKFPRHYDE